jgi:hypothetical protein
MPPTFLVEFGPEAIRHPRRFVLFRRVTPWAGRAGAAAGVGIFAFPWSIGMAFTHPAAVLAQRAFHGSPSLRGLLPRISHHVRFGHAEGSGQQFGWPGVCRPEIVVRRAASSRPKIRADVGAFPATSLAGEPRLYIGKPDGIRPSVAADCRRMAAPIIRSIDQETANAGGAHLSEGDLLAGDGHALLKRTLQRRANRPIGWVRNKAKPLPIAGMAGAGFTPAGSFAWRAIRASLKLWMPLLQWH